MSILGFVAPWAFLLGFFGAGEASVPLFFTSILASDVASAVAADLSVSALVCFVFVYFEAQRVGMTNAWVFVPAALLVGLSFGLPLFLYLRARRLEQRA